MTIEHKGAPVTGDRDCILQYFAKKSGRGVTAKTYNFLLTLELNAVIKHAFYQRAYNYKEQEDVSDAEAPTVS